MGMKWTEVITFQENWAFYSPKYKTIKVQKNLSWFLGGWLWYEIHVGINSKICDPQILFGEFFCDCTCWGWKGTAIRRVPHGARCSHMSLLWYNLYYILEGSGVCLLQGEISDLQEVRSHKGQNQDSNPGLPDSKERQGSPHPCCLFGVISRCLHCIWKCSLFSSFCFMSFPVQTEFVRGRKQDLFMFEFSGSWWN